ncbi:MAG: hypothetical protein V1824_02510 [archaeon]
MSNMIIADSCSLILLEKADMLKVLLNFTKIIIPQAVFQEVVVNGISKGFTDAQAIQQYIEIKKIIIKNVEIIERYNITLQQGELEAINLYKKIKADILITDDKKAMKICGIENIKYITTIQIIIDLFNSKKIKKENALDAIKIVSKKGRYKEYIISEALELIKG